MFEEKLVNATKRPSDEMQGYSLLRFSWAPPEPMLTSSVSCAQLALAKPNPTTTTCHRFIVTSPGITSGAAHPNRAAANGWIYAPGVVPLR